MKTYLVRLRPLGEFFFGAEKGFIDSRRDDFTKQDDITYYLQSRQFPQQTSLLGMLRKEILIQTAKIKSDNYSKDELAEIKKLIGAKSFCLDDVRQDFGYLNEISPLILYDSKKGQFYLPVPKDHKKPYKSGETKERYTPFKLNEKSMINTNFGPIQPFFVTKKVGEGNEYDPKIGLSEDFINLDTKDVVSKDKIFIPFEKIGINKYKTDDAYYKQVFYHLRRDTNDNAEFEFAFFLKTNYEFSEKSTVYLGKERSTFQLIFEEREKDFDALIKQSKLGGSPDKIILVSDSYIETPLEGISWSINESITFRNFSWRGNGKMIPNEKKYNFWKRGSVIYVKKGCKNKVISQIRANKNLYQIGYNYAI